MISAFKLTGDENKEKRRAVRDMLTKHPIIAHRGTFEGMWLKHKYGVTPQLHYDTKLGAYLRDENEPSGLKYQAVKHLGVEPWDDVEDFADPDWEKMLPYNAKDSAYGMRLYKEVDVPFLRSNPKVAKLMKYILLPAEEVFIDVIVNGFHIDIEAAKKKLLHCQVEKERLNDELNKISGKEVNPGSPKQMVELLYRRCGLTCSVKTAKGNPSSGEPALLRLAGQHPAVDLLTQWRDWDKKDSTYLTPWINNGPILHANYDFTGTDTGRLSSSMVKNKRHEKGTGATIHQCPRDGFIRNIIVPRKKGWRITAGDLSQAELRGVAHASGDPTMIGIFNDAKLDIHIETLKDVIGIIEEITKEARKKAKAVNFGFIYGMFAKKFRIYAFEKFGIRVTQAEAEEFRDAFFAKYAGLLPWHRRVEKYISINGFIDSVFGRRRHLPQAKYDSGVDEWIRNEAVRQAINSPIQSMASDIDLWIAALTMSKSIPWTFKIDPEKAFCIGAAHDSLLFENEPSYSQELKEGLEYTAQNLPTEKYFGFKFQIPILMDVNTYQREWEGELAA